MTTNFLSEDVFGPLARNLSVRHWYPDLNLLIRGVLFESDKLHPFKNHGLKIYIKKMLLEVFQISLEYFLSDAFIRKISEY